MQQTFVLPAVAEDHVETETAAAVTQTAEAPETKAAKTEVQEQKAPETQAPVTEAPKPEVQETKETPAPATEAPKPEVQETQETPAPATEAPVTEAPQTEAPVTEAPQTEAPVTEAPQTEAPVTEAPQTEAPVTEAPETEAPVTEAPETEAPVTEAPETEAPATEAPETETEIQETETETESETESDTETEAPKTHFTYEDGRVRITADASESAKLPQDAVLKADYLAPGSAAYNAAVAKVKAAYGLGDDVELECAPYDIYFVSKGNRIEPENGTVKVTIQFVKPVLGEAEGDLIDKGIAHIKDNGSVEDLNGSVNTNAQGAVSSVGFTTDSFSVFAPFTVSQVTAQAATSSNLNQFVTNVVFDNNLYDADGALVLHPNSEYSFKMEFAESIDKGLFEKEGVLTYTFPAQLTPAGAGGTFDMNITAGETQYTLSGNTYTIEGNTIKVSFNKDGGAAYEALKAASNAEFWLSLRAKVDANASGDKIKFGDSVEKTVKFDNTAAVSVEKSGSYDKTSGKMNYTVKVKSTGTSTNVKVTDVITGTLLTYDKNVTATSNQKGALTVDPNATAKGNGFEYTIPSMSDGEEVTFSYSASVDYSKLSGDKFTADETKNTVTAKGDNTDEVSKDHNFDHTMAYDTGITKSGTKGEITTGWQTSNWTITVNADSKTDVGGSLVTDKIQENKKVPTKYSGAGITVKKYKADGTLVSSEPIPWDQLKSHSDTTWSYELPQKDGTPYKYEISYTTTSDISKTTENTSVTNHAEFDGKGTDGSVGVEGQNQFGVTKTHAAPSKDGVNWTVDVTIPNCGFNESFTITDALPFTWTGGYHADSYKEGSLQIAMNGQTIAADNYDIKYTAPVTEGHNKSSGSIQVVFKPEKLAGLFPATTGTERVLTMTYTTIPDSTWPDGENHTNTVTATGDGTSKNASDSYILKEHEISKSVENGNATIGGMPAYKFKIYLRGVDTDTLEIHDIFDPDLFEIVTTDSNSYNNAQFGAGDESWIADNGANGSSNGGTLTVTPTETGATFSIKNVATKSGGAYYSWYSIRYYLKVKDAEALKKIQQEAAKNPDHTTKIGNTAEWEGKSTGEVSVDYKVNPLTKTETGSPNKLNHYTSTFTVVVNPDKLQLNGGNDLTVTDTFSDAMELVTDSVQITLEPEGTSSWDFDTDKKGLTVTIPDECKATITYQAQIIGTGTVTYKNNVTVTGNYTASTGDKTAQITTDGEGSAEHFQYKVIKRDAHDKQKRLQGAIFQLFELTDGSETAVKNNKTGGDVTFTTDANGEFMMAGAYQADGWELTKGHTYVLKEIQAPEGYKKADPLTFTVGSITADGAHGNGYTFDIYDEEGKDIDISVVKTWNDADNQDGKRPESVMVQLYANGHPQSDPVELNAGNNWSYKWEKLPDKENGELIAYTVRELQRNEDGSMTPVDDRAKITYLVNNENVTYEVGYSNTDNAWTISNTHTPETINIEGSKTWDDANNQDGKRPSSITIRLYADGTELTDKVQTVTAANNWSWKFTDLPKYKDAGTEIEYTITEDAVENYMTVVDGYNVTNMHIPATINISGGKHWDDANNQDGKRPSSITIRLYADGTALTDKVQTVTAADNWKWTFTNLPKYANGREIVYTISEDAVTNYTTSVSGYNVTNTYTPEVVRVVIRKVWDDENNQDGKRPTELKVDLKKKVGNSWNAPNELVQTITLNEGNGWQMEIENLPKYTNGKLNLYNWSEHTAGLEEKGYYFKSIVTEGEITTLTNTHVPEKVEASVRKVWDDNNNQDGKRPTGITVKLYGKAGEAAAEEILETTLNEANNWKYTKTDLLKFKNGVAYTYYWTEETQLPGYTVEAAQQNGEKSFVTTLTNTHTPEKASATVEKRWRDNDNQDRKRPESITVILKKSVNGLVGTVDTYTLTAGEDGSWKKTVDDLPKYENGTEIQYFWEESQEGLNGYQPLPSETGDNMTLLVNAYTPEETSVSVQKVWNDDGNRDGIRPESITVTLYAEADGVAKHKVDEAVLNEINHWAATKSGLAKNVNGKPYTYTWEEENVPEGYTLTTGYDSEDTSKTILTNTHTPETVNATVVKVWDDADNQDGKRPQDLTVTLMKNETVVVQTVTLDAANNWTAEVENLAKNENGTPIRYSWVEGTMPEGYSLESAAVTDEKNSDDVVIGTITTLTNTYAPGKVSASVKKVWDDTNNQDGIRPETLRVNLLKNGQATDQFVILSEENRWSATLDNLDEYTDGTLNEYTWSEELPNGYTVTVSDPDEVGTTTLTNTHTPATIGASVEKIWDDNDNQDGKRPEKLLVTLMRRIREQAVPISLDDADDADTNPAEEVKTVELTAAHNWKASVSNLPKYKDGQMYEYFWTEKEDNIPNGYKLTNEVTYNILSPGEGVTGFITRLTNSHKPQKINAIVKKVWDDNENQDGKRASELTVELMRNGTEVAGTVTLNEENNWTDTVENLDKYTGGVENGYTWVEKNLPEGYSLTDTKKEVTEATENTLEAAITTLTNSYTPGKVEASVLKVWNDGENQDGIRPSEITVTLVKNNEPTTQSVTLSEVNHWTAAITGLDEYTNGTLNEYTWKEAEVPDGYTLTNTKKEGRLTTLTNTHTPEVVNATIRKTWNDSDNQDGVRPTEIKVDLKKNDQVIQTVTLDTANGWETTVEDLPKYTAGVENIYTWAEQEDGLPEGYELTGDVTVGEVTTLTNTRVPDTVSVGVRKIWNDAENQDGIRPSELRVDLLKNGELTGQYVILNEENGWTAMITNLPKNTAVAEPNVYTWSEELPDGYTVTVSDPDEMGITTLTNTHTPDTIEASVEKTWDDNDDQDGKRPEKLFVTLMRRIREQAVPISLDDVGTNPAEEVKTVELTAANDWKASVSDLPKYSDGQMYEYFWTEKEDNIPDGYELTNEVTYDILSPGKGVTGFITTLTNTHTPQKINAVVKKVWDDKDNQDGKRPTELTVDLMRNGTEVAGTVTLNEENGWTDTVENLDKYTGGVENVYTWAEKNLPEGYSLTDTKKEVTEATEDTLEAAITTLTNKHTPGKVSASILKIWDDAKNQDGKRPETITAILVKNGEETDQKVTLSADNEWSAIIKDLDEYTNGTLNKYTWKEAEVPEGYELTLNKTDGTFTTLTNTHVPELVNVSVRKEWDDADNQDGIRPAELKVDLKKNGEVIATVTLNEENSWSDGVKDLPKYTAGVENIYTWAEQEDGLPEGYELTDTKTEELLAPPMEGEEVLPTETVSIITTLTNTHTPETVNIEGAKTWADSGNESARPESITIRIYADGEELTDLAKTVTADDDWKWSFTDLPKYKEGEVGQEITYTITEDPVDGYISEVDGYDVTNTRSAAVSKVDIGTGEELTGAHFQVLDGAGNIVDEWDSESGTNHVIKGIETDVEYTLHESKAPEGYEVTADVTFTVAKDGTVTATASVVNGVIIVEDKLKPSENTSTTIEKKITYNGLELFAENLSFYVRLFYDKECTKPATELKEIKIVNAMSGKVTFDNLEAGRTYYAGECDADGNVMYSGVLEDGTVYTPVFTGTNGQVVTVEEGENKVVYLDNQLQSWPHNFYAKGTLTVTKKLLGADGEAKDSDEVFYAGIFDDPEYTTLSERVEYNLLELDMSGGSETSMSTNVQIESLDSVTTLYVTEVDEDGNPVKGAPGFAYEVSADKTEVNIDPKHTKAEVTITNKEKSYEGRLTVTKKLVTEDGRAKDSDETFYAGIFDDADFTQLSDKVEENILTLALNGASEVTAQTKVKVDSADSVTTLYVTEVDVDGNPVKEMAGFKYGVSVDKEEVEIAAGREASVIITNVELPHNPYQHGELTVTKKLLGADGKPKNSNGVFYAGIFDDPEYTTLSDKVEYNVLELDLNGNAEASAMTKVDIAKKDSTVTLYVTEVDEEGNPIAGAAGFKYEVSVDQTKVDLTAERSKAVVVITNKEVPETESETQPTTKPTKGVKTGDDTPIGGYAGLMAIAFAAFALLVVSEQKRRKSGRE